MSLFNRILIVFMVAPYLMACNGNQEKENTTIFEPLEFYGGTQGTTFAVICNDPIELEQKDISELLDSFDLALSGYISESIVTKLNESKGGAFIYDDHEGYFNRCYEQALEVFNLTDGAFDPTVYPLVEGWGFLKEIDNIPDSITVDSLRSLIGFSQGYHFDYKGFLEDSLQPTKSEILKQTPNAKLDFNAIAQGLAVDVIAERLEEKGATNYFVEIGGEIRVSGVNKEGITWRIGIDEPIENSTAENRELTAVINLKNKSVATSGSYRKFYEKDGEKYSHTLDPKSGYPVRHNLLSATVVHPSCGYADAMATAFMVMGTEKTIQFLDEHPEQKIEAYLIYTEKGEEQTYMTPGFKRLLAQ